MLVISNIFQIDRVIETPVRTHGCIGQLVYRSMRVNTVDVWSSAINATKYECGTNVALVAEQHALEQRGGRAHRHRAPRVQPLQLQLRRHRRRRHLCVCRGTRPATVHVPRQVMNLFTILVRNYSVFGSSSIGTQNNTVSVNYTHDRGTSLCGLRSRKTFLFEECISESDTNNKQSAFRL